jgi:hypothetical protein
VELKDVEEHSLENIPVRLMHKGEHFDNVTQNKHKKTPEKKIQMS